MRWINHKVITFSAIYLITENFVTSLVSAFGAIFPDIIEGKDYHSPGWKKKHRTVSHWILPYLCLLIYLFLSAKRSVLFTPGQNLKIFGPEVSFWSSFYHIAFWFVVGCVFHVIQDGLTGGIPVFHPWKRSYFLKISRTGNVFEYLLSFVFIFFFILKFLF